MKLFDNFPAIDDDDNTTIDAIFYMTQQDMEDLVVALNIALVNPKLKFSQSWQGVERKRNQFKLALKKLT